ncbi:MAG: aspartate/glutamate racemase family protein [Sphingomonadales bacterium]
MSTPKRIHVITPVTMEEARPANPFAAMERPGISITQEQITRGPATIESEFDEVMAAPETMALALKAEADGADAIIIDCLGDPAVKPTRELLSIPVLGPGQTALHWAAMLAGPFGVITVLDSVRPMLENAARVHGLDCKLRSVRVVNIPVMDLEQDLDRVTRALCAEAVKAVTQDKVRGIVLGCTGMMGCAQAVEKALMEETGRYVPVIDPVPAAIQQAIAFVAQGVSHSKLTYGTPPEKPMPGMNFPGRS